MRNQALLTVMLISCLGGLPFSGHAQESSNASANGPGAPSQPEGQSPRQPLPRFGLAVGVSSLGATIQAATAVTRHSDVRVGFSDLNYTATINKDGIAYNATLDLRSAEILYDQSILGPFHISAGAMMYDGNKITGNASASPGQAFTLGGMHYYSQAGNPITGTAAIGASKAAPMVLLGLGNLLPRSHRHFTLNFELGAAYQGSPSAVLNLNGGACIAPGSGCLNAASDPTVRANVQSEQNKLNSSLSVFKFYPVLSLTFGYKF